MKWVLRIPILFILITSVAHAAGSFGVFQVNKVAVNNGAPLGMNLFGPVYYSQEFPFLNAIKSGVQWYTTTSGNTNTGEEQYLQLDTNGYPTTLTGYNNCGSSCTFTQATLIANLGTLSPYYPIGASNQYIFLYSGATGSCTNAGTFTFGGDASVASSSCSGNNGRIVLNITPSTTGILIHLTATDTGSTGNYATNFQLVQAEYESNLTGGAIFHPDFVNAIVSQFKFYRFLDWIYTNNSLNTTWALRSIPGQVFYGAGNPTLSGSPVYHNGIIPIGVPAEVLISLCNQANATLCWFNMGQSVSDDYVLNFAALCASTLNAKAAIEYGNEFWNGGNGFSDYLAAFNAHYVNTSQSGWTSSTTATVLGTSATSLAVPAAGSVINLTTGSGISFNQHVLMQDHSNAANWAIGYALAYSGTALQVYVQNSGGSGTPTQWDLYGGWTVNSEDASYYAARSSKVMSLWYTAYGASAASKLIRVTENQLGNNGVVEAVLAATQWTGAIDGVSPPASGYVDVADDAPYLDDFGFITNSTNWGALYAMGGSDAATALDYMFDYIFTGGTIDGYTDPNNPSGLITQLQTAMASDLSFLTTNYPSIGLVVYESGTSFQSSDADTESLFNATNLDSRIGPALVDVYNAYQALTPNPASIKIYNHYQDVSYQGFNGNWGALITVIPPNNTPKYNSLCGIVGLPC